MRSELSTRFAPSVQSVFRVVVGFLFACHGAASLFGVLGGAMGTHGGTVPAGAWPGWWAAVIQLVGGTLVALGLCTRVSALVCAGSMAYAYFTVHQAKALLPIQNSGEPSALYAWAFLAIAALGPGPWAVGNALRRLRNRPPAPTAGTAGAQA
ncbi:DoxX family protein [Amycolatopsis sp. NPDC059027]|uniref:DoxX family protein n=1 Tax=unclassified Amycolatopsis TaxID=2618356 RepID=UPI003670C0EA